MLFNSFAYLLFFLPLTVGAQALARSFVGARAAQVVVLLASLVFYAWAGPAHLPLLCGSILVNWLIARAAGAETRPAPKKRWLLLGLVANIAFLCLFKYVNFFLSNLALLGLPRLTLPDWALPLGISFFTLQQVMYLVDCYEGLVPASSLLDHASFVAFFPYLTSGPLARAKAMVPQLAAPKLSPEARVERAARGLFLFSLGLAKKVLIADSFGRVADIGFASSAGWSTIEAWAFSVAYTMQIYFDFSGYTDMAVGSAALLGIEIPRNFNAPFRSRTVTEFWQRWHMSLSSFITTYLYTPILQSFRRATLATAAIATLLAMTIAGLWHGPSWTFIVFGLLHGLALVVNQYWKKTKRKLPRPIGVVLTFAFVNLAFVFFRSPTLAAALHAARRLLPAHGAALLATPLLREARAIGLATLAPPILAGLVGAFAGKSSDDLARSFRPTWRAAMGAAALILLAALYMNSNIGKAFVYFAF